MIFIRNTVKKVIFSDNSSFTDGILRVSKTELSSAALKNIERPYSFDIDIAYPGEKTRIVHITDAIKPSFKPGASAFPGWTDGVNNCGKGITYQLEGIALLQSFAHPAAQEGIVDMSGEGAKYSEFSKKINLVMCVKPGVSGIDKAQLAYDLVKMHTQAAEYLASLSEGSKEIIEEYPEEDILNGECELPKVAYAYFLQAQGPFRNVFLFGKDCTKLKATYVSPLQIMDGAIVSGNYIIACQKNPTIYHQENPVVKRGMELNGKSIRFVGAFTATESSLLDGKRDNAMSIAKAASDMGCQGVIITQEGGGHADVDLIFTGDACTEKGIKTVIIANEIAGPDGSLPPLVSFSDKSDAIVTTGNNDQIIKVDPMEKAIGGDVISGGAHGALDGFSTALGIMYTSTNQLGVSKMTTKAC